MSRELKFTTFTPDRIDDQFKQVERISPDLSYEEIISEFRRITVNRIMPGRAFQKDSPELVLYRVTPNYINFNPEVKSCFSYNPEPTEIGRAHIVGNPVFYGSFDPLSAILEMKGKIKNNESFFISKWKIKFTKTTFIQTFIINSNTIKKKNVISSIAEKHSEGLHEIIKNDLIQNINKEGVTHAVEKMGNLFATIGSDFYHITSAYCHDLLYSDKIDIPIIEFPAIENDQKSVNWAIHPRFVDSEQMELDEVYEVSIQENNKDGIRLSFNKKGVFEKELFSHWEYIYFSNLLIDYNTVQIITCDNQKISGLEAADLKMEGENEKVKHWLSNITTQEFFQNWLFKQTPDDENEVPFSSTKSSYKKAVLIKLDHGTKIFTSLNKTCIHICSFTITWDRDFRKKNKENI